MFEVTMSILALIAIYVVGTSIESGYQKKISTAAIIEVDDKTYRCVPVKVTTSVEDVK